MHSDTTYRRGLWAEFLARMYLRLHGYRIVACRYVTGKNTHRAEIDIIARRKNTLVFIEVKSRPDVRTAFAAITTTQRFRLRRAAETYIARTGWRGDARFDVIAVCGRKIHWIRGAL